MKQLLKKAKQIAILILAISLTTCTNDDVELPKVVAGFTYTLNLDTGTVTFINISENSRTYTWDFGDGTNSTEINPIKTYENGTYTITLEAENSSGASDTFEGEITILIPEIATLPISFDGENTSYNAETFGGASFGIVDNPDPSGSNTSTSKVGAVTNIGAAFEGFYFDLGSPIDLTTLGSISMNFWADSPVDVLMKLEEGTAGSIEATASHGGTGWEVIYFTFDSTASYSRLTMFVDGPGTTAGTFYLDDIMQVNTADIPCPETDLELPIDFDCNGIDYAAKIVGDVSFEVVDNPELSGINSEASKVGKITNTGANWENAFFNLDTAVDFSVEKAISLKLFSDQALPIKLKLEDGTEADVEADVDHGGTGWEVLTFNYTSSASYNDMILFVDGPGTAAGTFYIDDIEQVTGESCEAESMQSLNAADFNLTFQSDPSSSITEDNTTFEYVDNPDFSADPNKSCKAGKVTNSNQNPWDNMQIDLADKLTFTSGSNFTMKIYAPQSGYKVTLKLEDKTNAGIFTQVASTESTANINGWEELTFPFGAGDTGKYDKIVIFFDLETQNGNTYYFDDLKLNDGTGGGGGGGTFDDGLLTNGDFENGTEAWIGNALDVQTDGDNSYNFANVETAGDAFAVNLSQVVEIIQGETYTLSFDASSDGNRTIVAGIGLNQDPWTNITETVNLTNSTQTFTLELTAADFGDANSRVILDMGADTGVVVIDNVSLFCGDCSGGGGGSDDLTVAAPTPPGRNADDVISLFSNAYNNIVIDTWSADWDDSDIEDLQIEGNDTKKISFTNFIGVDFQSSRFDASAFTHFHMDIYTFTDTQDKSFNLKFSNWNGGAGEANAIEYSVHNGNFLTNPNPGTWISLDIPLANFTAIGNADRSDLVQFVITSNLGVVYVDNIYLYK